MSRSNFSSSLIGTIILALLIAACEPGNREVNSEGSAPAIQKLGTIDCDMVEATPVIFNGRLYRFEYVRPDYKPNTTGNSYFRFVDVKSGEVSAGFAKGYHLGSAFIENDVAYAYGVALWGKPEIRVFWSRDLKTWEDQSALTTEGWGIYNNSVCRENGRYIMAFEVGEPPEVAGERFTTYFAESEDLLNWKLLPLDCVYTKERYSACPSIRFLDGYFYLFYLEAIDGPEYETYLVRSKDLKTWESSPLNPILRHSPEDKQIANPKLTEKEQVRIRDAVNRNNSDFDLCEFDGKVVICYSWGSQQGVEHLAAAEYDGSLAEFLHGYFPDNKPR